MEVLQIQQQIYAEIVRLLVPANLPGVWRSQPAPADFFETPPLAEERLAKLEGQFPMADLLAAGVVVDSGEPGVPPQFHPQLREPGSKWLSLRETPASPPFDLVGDHGTLSGRLPVLAALIDHRIAALLTAPCDLLVTGTVVDAAALLTTGLPAMISTGLHDLKQGQLREFCHAFALKVAGDPLAGGSPVGRAVELGHGATEPAPPDSDPPGLILVGWSPGSFCPDAAGQNAVRSFLGSLHTQLKIPTSDFGWWQPSLEDLTKLELAVKTLDTLALHEFLIECLEICEPLVRIEPRKQTSPSPAAAFAKSPRTKSPLNPLASKLGTAEQWKVLEEQIFTPLLQSATSDDPLQKNLKLTAVQVSKLLHNHLARLNEACSSTKKTWDEDDVTLRKLSQIQSLLDMTLKVTRALQGSAAAGH